MSFLLAPFLGRNFFPEVDGGQILMHVRAPVGMRIEGTAAKFNERGESDHQADSFRRRETAAVVDNIGTYLSSINTIYNNTGTIGESDGDIHHIAERGGCTRPTPAVRQPSLRERIAAPFSGHDLLIPAGRHRQSNLELRSTRTRSICRSGATISTRTIAYANKLLVPGPSRHRGR